MSAYYSIRMYIEDYPSTINCKNLLEMADEISQLLGCHYDHLGYMLLEPDYDFKDLGLLLKNNKNNREKFIKMSILQNYYGHKEELQTEPSIMFELKPKDNITLPYYLVQLDYPIRTSQYLCIRIDIKEDLLSKELTLEEFKCIQEIVASKGYIINSAFLHYYSGNFHRTVLDGIECGFATINDLRIINRAIEFHQEWKNKLMDVFYMNSFNKKIVTSETIGEIEKLVGNENIIEDEQKFIFKLPQSKSTYLLNRLIPLRTKSVIKKILQKEEIVSMDVPLVELLWKR